MSTTMRKVTGIRAKTLSVKCPFCAVSPDELCVETDGTVALVLHVERQKIGFKLAREAAPVQGSGQ